MLCADSVPRGEPGDRVRVLDEEGRGEGDPHRQDRGLPVDTGHHSNIYNLLFKYWNFSILCIQIVIEKRELSDTFII